MNRSIFMGAGLALLAAGAVLGVRAVREATPVGAAQDGAVPTEARAEKADVADAGSPATPPETDRPDRAASSVEFVALDGTNVSIADYTGQVVVLNFWGTWCAPCRYEIPELVELQRVYGERGVVVIGVAVDSGEAGEIEAFADSYGINYPIWLSTMANALKEFGAVGYPYTLLIDREGRIREQHLGPQTFTTLAAKLNPLLAGV